MMPSLGQKYEIAVEIISKPRPEYQTDEYSKLNLPKAPAIMINDEIVVEGSDVDEGKIENIIRSHLRMPPLEIGRKGLLGRLLGR
ncbi:MAG: hypothetical protein HY787_11470 [Deltaproteobacteria bacterium]|nr:hypothetical protein [Deltaproteobacteria bacterium]